MQPGVDHHLVSLGEGLLAVLAAVGPRVCVNALMFSQEVPPLKVFRTKGALVRPLSRVGAAVVEDQLCAADKGRAAQLTDIWFLT